jgi:DNA invertase Pin-like site-specific DNA recombinase
LVAKAEALVEATGGISDRTLRQRPNPAASVLARRNAGRQIAIAKGVRFGPKPKLTDHQQGEALKRLAAGASCRAIAKTMGVHHATIARLTG